MTTITDSAPRAIAHQPGDAPAIWFLRSRMMIRATRESTHGAYGLTEVVVPPGFSPPMHVHHREDESFYVLEGEVTFQCLERTISAAAGSLVFLPRGVPHSFVVEGDVPARMLNLMTPGGGEGFFVEAGRPAEHDGPPPEGPIDVEVLRRASDLYGAAIVGPPLTPTR